jgi:hypothetical protein
MRTGQPEGAGEVREIRSYAEYEELYLPKRHARRPSQANRPSRSSLASQLSPERRQSIQERYFANAQRQPGSGALEH